MLEPGMAVGPIAAEEVGPAIDESGPSAALFAEAGRPSCPCGATRMSPATATTTSPTMARSPRRSIAGSVAKPPNRVDDPVVHMAALGGLRGRTRAVRNGWCQMVTAVYSPLSEGIWEEADGSGGHALRRVARFCRRRPRRARWQGRVARSTRPPGL